MISKELVTELQAKFSDKLVTIAEGGSAIVPFITHPDDIDVILIIKEDVELELEDAFRKHCKETYNAGLIVTKGSQDLLKTSYAYEGHYATAVYDLPLQPNLVKDITVHKEEHLAGLKELVERLAKVPTRFRYNAKSWYRIYASLCILDANSYNLNADKIAEINMLHDDMSETKAARKILIDGMISRLG